MKNTLTKTQMKKMIKEDKLKFIRYAASITLHGQDLEVYELNDKEYRIFSVFEEKRTPIRYVDIAIKDYIALPFDVYKTKVRFNAVVGLFDSE